MKALPIRSLLPFLVLVGSAVAQVPNPPGGAPPGGGDDPPGRGIAIHRLNDLEFGTVTAGWDRRINPSDPEAALFEVNGPRMSHVSIEWDLPPTMGGVPLTFDGSSAAWATTSSASQQNVFNPHHDQPLRFPASGTLYLWLGGIAEPLQEQASGAFTGNISLTVTLEHD